jgi:glycosyltransferase involved in cell wall biosynthesis
MGRRLLLVGECLVGGLGAAVIDQAAWFSERGWDVTVAAPPDPDGRWSRLVCDFVPLAMPESARQLGKMVATTRTLRALQHDLRPDVVHCHGVRPFVATRLATSSAPYVTLHGAGTIEEDPPGYARVRAGGLAVVPRLARHAFTAAPGVGHGWDFLLHASPMLRDLEPVPFPGPDTVPTFLWLARIDHRKPGDVVVRALAALGKERKVRGIVAGDGPMVDRLAALVDSLDAPVELVGHQPPAPLLAEAWGLGLFSSQEAVTFAVQEAMWVGRPVVCSSLPGLRWLVGDTGFLADDVRTATDALRRLCDHETASTLGRRAAERARELLVPDATWPATEKVYLDELGSRASR